MAATSEPAKTKTYCNSFTSRSFGKHYIDWNDCTFEFFAEVNEKRLRFPVKRCKKVKEAQEADETGSTKTKITTTNNWMVNRNLHYFLIVWLGVAKTNSGRSKGAGLMQRCATISSTASSPMWSCNNMCDVSHRLASRTPTLYAWCACDTLQKQQICTHKSYIRRNVTSSYADMQLACSGRTLSLRRIPIEASFSMKAMDPSTRVTFWRSETSLWLATLRRKTKPR